MTCAASAAPAASRCMAPTSTTSASLTSCCVKASAAVQPKASVRRVVAEAAPCLVELDVANCRLLTDAGLENLVQLTQLRRLNLSRCVQVTDAGIARLVQCAKLADLNVSYCDQLTDAALVYISNLRELQVLDIAGCWRLTFRGLVPLARFANLRILRGSSSP